MSTNQPVVSEVKPVTGFYVLMSVVALAVVAMFGYMIFTYFSH